MEERNITCHFYFEDLTTNRKELFKKAILSAKDGKVLYILCDEIDELPELSQDLLGMLNGHYMKMISFLYVKTLESLIESVSTLPTWQSVPSSIILDDLSKYCDKNSVQNACGIVALLIDTMQSCAASLCTKCELSISVSKETVGEEYCNTLKELYRIN